MKIRTDNKPRDLLSLAEIPIKVAKREFDYVDQNSDEAYNPCFSKYKNHWYDIKEFEWTNPQYPAYRELNELGWDGIQTDSYFSGVLVKYPPSDRNPKEPDFERVIVGNYYA